MSTISIVRLGVVEYQAAIHLQERLAAARTAGARGDMLLLVEHPPVITIGQGGGEEDILVPASFLQQAGIGVCATDRGGRATYHGPGQLVAYPILKPANGDLHRYVWRLEEVIIRLLATYGLAADRLIQHPGVWIGGKKVASVGIAVRDGVTRHGLALNVAPCLEHYRLLIPCGIADAGVTSLEQELGAAPDRDEVAQRFVHLFGQVFGCCMVEEPPDRKGLSSGPSDLPPWLSRRVSTATELALTSMEQMLADLSLHTVCQEASCPNLAECFARGTATFLILGERCTRDCRFCAIQHGRPRPPDPGEPDRVAEASARLGLQHVVVTSVTRDDLPDGGASQFAATVIAVRRRLPGVTVEVLIPDLGGAHTALEVILEARPDVLNHNLETVPRLYSQVRSRANYHRSLAILARTKTLAPGVATKSGLMLGLGERTIEVLNVLHDLHRSRCDFLTLGQYLQPTEKQLRVHRYVPPEEFDWYRDQARQLGFAAVVSGPLARSSYQASAIRGAIHR